MGDELCRRVLAESYSGDFLKEALMQVPKDKPFRGPMVFSKGEYHYHCKVDGDFIWFHGYEEIFYEATRVYECYFHGAKII